MSTNELQQQTTVNVQEKANLIWAIADKLVGVYKPHEYGNVILPMCVVKRFEDVFTEGTRKTTNKTVVSISAKVLRMFLSCPIHYSDLCPTPTL